MTATYMFRAVFLTFHGKSRVDHGVAHHLHESPGIMTVPLIILAILSVIGGFIGFPVIEGGNKFAEFLAPVFAPPAGFPKAAEAVHHAVSFEVTMMIVSLVIAGLGILLAYRFYIKNPALPDRLAERYKAPYNALVNKYWVDEIYNFIFVRFSLMDLDFFLEVRRRPNRGWDRQWGGGPVPRRERGVQAAADRKCAELRPFDPDRNCFDIRVFFDELVKSRHSGKNRSPGTL